MELGIANAHRGAAARGMAASKFLFASRCAADLARCAWAHCSGGCDCTCRPIVFWRRTGTTRCGERAAFRRPRRLRRSCRGCSREKWTRRCQLLLAPDNTKALLAPRHAQARCSPRTPRQLERATLHWPLRAIGGRDEARRRLQRRLSRVPRNLCGGARDGELARADHADAIGVEILVATGPATAPGGVRRRFRAGGRTGAGRDFFEPKKRRDAHGFFRLDRTRTAGQSG